MARRYRRSQVIVAHEKHADTKIFVIGPGTTTVSEHILRDSQVGDRKPAGGNDTIQLGRSFGEECNIGDTCKYINIHIQAGPRVISTTNTQNSGWIEWGFVIHKGTDVPPTTANTGTLTLGNILTNYYREQCIFTGSIPVGGVQPVVAEIRLKIPPKQQVLRVGDEWTLYIIARTISSVATATDTFKVVTSCNYINKH